MSVQALESTERYLADLAATDALGRAIGRSLIEHRAAIEHSGFQINLSGDLGAGKTALVRAALRALGVTGSVKSPTFSLLEPYKVSRLDFYHFDFYRFEYPAEFAAAGFRDCFGAGRVCAIEWPERAGPRLPTADLAVALSIEDVGRRARLAGWSELGRECLRSALNIGGPADA